MGFPFYIARRYLFSKKSHNVINIISGISVCGVAIATTALVCILSVFNGFQDMISGLFTTFDPQLKVVPAEGKYMDATHPRLVELSKNEDIAVYTNVVEDNAVAMLYNRQAVVTVKGVDDNYRKLVDIESVLHGDGSYMLGFDVIDYGIFGIGVLHYGFGVDVWYDTPVKMYAPRKGAHIDLNDPMESFNEGDLYCPNVAFETKQGKYDSNYVITSLGFAQNLFEKEGQVTSVELKIDEGVDIDDAEEKIEAQLGDDFVVKNRYEQQEDTFKIMQIEKLISYIFLTFVLVVASFNIISSLSMLMIDKKNDVKTLRNMGASDSQIVGIFMMEGRMISLIGAIIGIMAGVSLCLLQQHFGFVKLGSSSESYIIDAYPVKIEMLDVLVTFVTVLIIGFISVWYPVKRLSRFK